MKVTKQSLIDWEVTDGKGKHVAWIKKVKDGYELAFKEFGSAAPYWFRSFKEAKQFAVL